MQIIFFHKKRPAYCRSFLELLQARLELAPRVNPDWILSPTRLPIPPLERGNYIQFSCYSGIGRKSTSPLLKSSTVRILVGRVPLELIVIYRQLLNNNINIFFSQINLYHIIIISLQHSLKKQAE